MAQRPRIVLGISDSHDAGAALVVEGRLVAAVNEERLNRRKMSGGLPLLSIPTVLRIAGVQPTDVDRVAVAGRVSLGEVPLNNDFSRDDGTFGLAQHLAEGMDGLPGLRQAIHSDVALASYQRLMPLFAFRRRSAIVSLLLEMGIRAEVASAVVAFDHHDAHVASAYYTAGMGECLILSNDGFGDGVCCKVALGRAEGIELLHTNSFVNSIGVLYNYATRICGFAKAHHAGKTTGLAAFGDPERTIDAFRQMCTWSEAEGRYVNRGPIFRRAIRQLENALAGIRREDVAAGVQKHVEDVLVAQARHYVRRTGARRIALVGGVHANVKANQRIAAIEGVEEVFVFPHMGDGGLAAGAAFMAQAEGSGGHLQPYALPHVYMGPAFTEKQVAEAAGRSGVRFERMRHPAARLALLLAEEKVIARFDGAMEYGPRALGNRSILYPATKPEVNKWLNQRLRRTEFMPFAPVVRAQDAELYFSDYSPVIARTAEFMTITCDATERCKREAPAIVHVDGTARPQVLRRDVNPDYYDIVDEYSKITGLSVLVNTSFNMHEEPIVCTPEDAIRAFLESNLDFLAMGPFIAAHPQGSANPSAS